MSFGIMFPNDTAKVLERMSAALVPGAPVSFTFWKKSGIWWFMHKAAILATCDQTIPPPKFYHPRWNHAETIQTALDHAGYKDIRITEADIPWHVENKHSFVNFTVSTPIWKDYVKNWPQEQQDKLVDCAMEVLDEAYPDAGHGPIDIPMVGFIVAARNR